MAYAAMRMAEEWDGGEVRLQQNEKMNKVSYNVSVNSL